MTDILPLSTPPADLPDVTKGEMAQIAKAWQVWAQKRPRNALRSRYFDGRVGLRGFSQALPQGLTDQIRLTLGWSAKTCTTLANRSVFEGFAVAGIDGDLGLSDLLDANRIDLELPQAILSAYKHSCAFLTVTRGADGQPVIQARSAEWTAGLWDRDRRVLSGMLAIKDVAKTQEPNAFDMHLPGVILSAWRSGASWRVQRIKTGIDWVTAEPIVYDADIDRPFGRSRITREVMSIQDAAVRDLARMEILGDYYSIPRLVFLGVLRETFADLKAKMGLDQAIGLTRDEDGQIPSVTQMTQATVEPLLAMYRQHASAFSAATSIPLAQLGIVTDNPASAEAMLAAERGLVDIAAQANRAHGAALVRLARKALALRDGRLPTVKITARWADPGFTTHGAAADFLLKIAAVFDWIKDSDAALETLGLEADLVGRLLADKRRAAASARLDALQAAVKSIVP